MPEVNQLTQLRKQIEAHFSEEEVRTLCFELRLDYDDLGGRGRAANIHELVVWAERRGRVSELMALVKTARPDTADVIALLPPHHIPFHKNELFTGRKNILTELQDRLSGGGAVAVTATGLGGVGKTQVALAYCYQHLDDYDLIQWLRAGSTKTLDMEMAELAYRLGLAQRTVTNQNDLRRLALNWLQTTDQHWLLIYDNADSVQPNDLRAYLPKMGNGASLITSRNPNWDGLAQTMRLDVFTRDEAVAFLLESKGVEEQEGVEGDAEQLADMLGYLPLALEHARAYVTATGAAWADYIEYFVSERKTLWEEAEAPADYDQRTITTTWEMAFTQVKKTPGAEVLLNLCCFLAPDEIPLFLISDAAGQEYEPPLPIELTQLANSKLKLNKAIGTLRRFSLLSRSADEVTIHRLVQTVARDQMPPEMVQTWVNAAVILVKDVFPTDQNMLYAWPNGARLLPHILSVIEQAVFYEAEPEATAYLCSITGFYLHFLGNYNAARPYSERAVAIGEQHLGENHPNFASHLSNLGSLLLDMGDYTAARQNFERALQISADTLGPDHPQIAIRLNNLGYLLKQLGDFEGARPYYERALQINEKTFGPDHPKVAIRLSNMGHLLMAEGNYAEARPLFERALQIFKNVFGESHPKVGALNNNLGQLLHSMGDYGGAQPLFERALQISEEAFGPNHPDVATRLNNMGQFLMDIGNYEDARPLLERALSIREAKLGTEHPYTQITRDNLDALLADLDRP